MGFSTSIIFPWDARSMPLFGTIMLHATVMCSVVAVKRPREFIIVQII